MQNVPHILSDSDRKWESEPLPAVSLTMSFFGWIQRKFSAAESVDMLRFDTVVSEEKKLQLGRAVSLLLRWAVVIKSQQRGDGNVLLQQQWNRCWIFMSSSVKSDQCQHSEGGGGVERKRGMAKKNMEGKSVLFSSETWERILCRCLR